MNGHRERLIREKLFMPLSDEEIFERKAVDPKQLSIFARYNWVVYRADEWFRCVDEEYSINQCEDAELIENYLNASEAHRIAHMLNIRDCNQPKGRNGRLMGMYKICTRTAWEKWSQSIVNLKGE